MDSVTIRNSNSVGGTFLLSPGAILQQRYRIVRQLGRGGMGAVYEATDLRLGHTVAVKQATTVGAEVWEQFEQEARLMAQLNHPALPRVSDYFTEANRAFLVMQYIEGSDLSEIITQQPGSLPLQTVIAWADQLLDALIYLHSHDRQIIHHDIKPHNLKLSPAGKIALLDFGLAKSHNGTAEGGLCRNIPGYSPRYAPLEQIQDLGTSPQSDIYALGATLYHLLTGAKPVDAMTRASALVRSSTNLLKPAHELNTSISRELSAILGRAMEQNPRDRYRSAREFRDDLRRVGRIHDGQKLPSLVRAFRFHWHRLIAERTLAGFVRKSLSKMFDPRASAALLLFLLALFAIFCRYYPWKLPSPASPAVTSGYLFVSSALEGINPPAKKRDKRSR